VQIYLFHRRVRKVLLQNFFIIDRCRRSIESPDPSR